MYRDDLILEGLGAGATRTATLADYTGLSTASVGRGLHRLTKAGHVFSPVRGVYRLTASGEALLGLPDGETAAAPEHSAEAASDQDPVQPEPLVGLGSRQLGPENQHTVLEHQEEDAAPTSLMDRWFDRGAFRVAVVLVLAGLVLGGLVLAAFAPRLAAQPPSMPPEPPGQPVGPRPFWLGVGPGW